MPKSEKSLTSIACIVRVSDEKHAPAIEQAVALAASARAHLHVTVIAPKANLPYSPMGTAFVAGMVADLNRQTMSDGDALVTLANHKMRVAGVKGEVHLSHSHVDLVAVDAVRVARTGDLIVVDQPIAMLDTKGLVLEEALFHSGRPVLVSTPRGKARDVIRRILVAWDGSQHAARALGDALALFPSIEIAEIVTVKGEKDISRALPGADLAHHLARKGVETSLTELHASGRSVGAVIDDHARNSEADLIVMGGFGHSRLREFLFGGVTVELTETAHVPLLMAY